VAATLKPSSDSDIKIEVWMPASGWNGNSSGRQRRVGGCHQLSGDGQRAPPRLRDQLHGYGPCRRNRHVRAWPSEKFIDFAYRSEHEMTSRQKRSSTASTARGPRLSYWNGCSTGGRQGLAEAQRFPDDYDGIIAVRSAQPADVPQLVQSRFAQATLKDPRASSRPAKYPIDPSGGGRRVRRLDGVTDGIIGDPTRCRFDPKSLSARTLMGHPA